MEIHQLRYFVAAARTGSISRAAERCRITQPSMSQQIRRLEDSLGVQLFDRLGRGVALTDAGRALLPRAERILADVAGVRDELASDVERGVGRFAIGAIPTIAPYLLPRIVAALRDAFPECELVVREDLTERLIERLVDRTLDAAIVSTPIDHEQIQLEIVGEERLVVVAPRSGHIEADSHLTLASLRELPRVSLHEMHCLGRQIAGFCSLRRVGANVVCHATQISTILELVAAGVGVSLVPEMTARQDANGERRYLPLTRNAPSREIAFASTAGRRRSAVAELAASLVTAAMRSVD